MDHWKTLARASAFNVRMVARSEKDLSGFLVRSQGHINLRRMLPVELELRGVATVRESFATR
jgi:hypothetical protein